MPQPFRFSVSLGGLDSADLTATAQRAEELGYSTVTLPDHLTDQAAPLLGLTAAALATTTLRVLPLVLANDYRQPVFLAKELATLDALSNGRLEVGLGAGWMTTDYEFAGVAHDSPGTRIRRLAESVSVIKPLLRGEAVSHDGEFYQVEGTLPAPLPVQEGGVPLMLAGGKQKMLTLAGAEADIIGINPGLTAGVIDERAGQDATEARTNQKLNWVKDGAGDRFDSLELQTRLHLAMISDNREEVAAEMAPLLGITAEEALGSPHALVGSVAQCIDEIKGWRDKWGISYISLDAESMQDFAPVVEALSGT
ncbi:MAG: TIGR03621 family F420-dependent LLM class oxidoreductase [Acidimicrobiales bacterium]|nr:TIGR03621 family F420-dependent LLM class oxidoreductase [Acidimicrobiales bacterium]RZV46661.1 MAG: TIGR03621 family F420-dependent LLM class oxidoreductase [Acidimicrobiales bacterium]